MVPPHKPIGETIRRPEPALSVSPTTRGTRFWAVGMTEVCPLSPPAGQKPFQSLTKTQHSSYFFRPKPNKPVTRGNKGSLGIET